MLDVWVCNSSPLIALARIQRLDLIESLAADRRTFAQSVAAARAHSGAQQREVQHREAEQQNRGAEGRVEVAALA